MTKENKLKKIPVTNNGKNAIPVGTSIVLPGETRHFDEHLVPMHLRPKKQEEAPPPPESKTLVDLLGGTVVQVVAALPDLSLDDLETLGDLEQGGLNRKGILSAIAEELLNRAEKES